MSWLKELIIDNPFISILTISGALIIGCLVAVELLPKPLGPQLKYVHGLTGIEIQGPCNRTVTLNVTNFYNETVYLCTILRTDPPVNASYTTTLVNGTKLQVNETVSGDYYIFSEAMGEIYVRVGCTKESEFK